MTTRTLITKDMPIAFILEHRPEARRIIDKYFGEACFDCPGVMWEPLSVEAALYGRSVEDMLAEINALEDYVLMLPINLDDEIEYQEDHARTKMLHDSPQFRAVLFCMEKGQGVGRHTSTSEVMMQVYKGSGTVIVGDKEYRMKEGEMIVSRPNEVHGFRSEGERFVILALIVPQPT